MSSPSCSPSINPSTSFPSSAIPTISIAPTLDFSFNDDWHNSKIYRPNDSFGAMPQIYFVLVLLFGGCCLVGLFMVYFKSSVVSFFGFDPYDSLMHENSESIVNNSLENNDIELTQTSVNDIISEKEDDDMEEIVLSNIL
jgi:hypothetical protein